MYQSLWRNTLYLLKNTNITSKENLVFRFSSFSKNYSINFGRMDISMNVFRGVTDRYDGITVSSSKEPCDIEDFPKKLTDSLTAWVESKRRTIWFNVDVKDSDWVPILAKNGFNYHHARQGMVMMYKWLLGEQETCNVPPYAHTNLGVGAVVINDENQILVVSERHFNFPHWKLPGGYVEVGEDIPDAAIREVKEETGIVTEFHSIIAFRHAHKMMFGNSDIYMIVNLIPLSKDIVQCKRELVGCQWMDVQEYLKHPNVHFLNQSLVHKTLEFKSKGIKFSGVKDKYKLYTMEKEFIVFTLDDDTELASGNNTKLLNKY